MPGAVSVRAASAGTLAAGSLSSSAGLMAGFTSASLASFLWEKKRPLSAVTASQWRSNAKPAVHKSRLNAALAGPLHTQTLQCSCTG